MALRPETPRVTADWSGDQPFCFFNDIYYHKRIIIFKNIQYIMDENKKKIVIDKFLKGDVNKDGKVNIADVTALIDALLNYQENLKKFDHNADGKVNIVDLTTLIDKILSGDDDVKVTDLTDLIDYLLSAENNIKEYDIDGNGEFNSDDVKALINQILNA